jgi:hypothetical protein
VSMACTLRYGHSDNGLVTAAVLPTHTLSDMSYFRNLGYFNGDQIVTVLAVLSRVVLRNW